MNFISDGKDQEEPKQLVFSSLQKSQNGSTTCSSKTMKGSKNVTSSNVADTNASMPTKEINTQNKEGHKIDMGNLDRQTRKQDMKSLPPTIQSARMQVNEDSILGHQFKRF